MESNMIFEGGCSCRAVRYAMVERPLIVHACHCRQCQRVTGSAFVMNALIEKVKVDLLSGDIQSFHFPDTCHTAYFCRKCATYVWSEYKSGRFDDCWFMRVGALDEPDHLPPDVHIYVESKQPWVRISDNIPVYEKFYKIQDVWDVKHIARIATERNLPSNKRRCYVQ
jgi:hypothetical protein